MQMRYPVLQRICAAVNWYLDSLQLDVAGSALKSQDSAQET